jgi:hypothetical protein
MTKPGDTALGHKIREAGYDKRKIRPETGGKQLHLYGPAAMSDDEWKAIYRDRPAVEFG